MLSLRESMQIGLVPHVKSACFCTLFSQSQQKPSDWPIVRMSMLHALTTLYLSIRCSSLRSRINQSAEWVANQQFRERLRH